MPSEMANKENYAKAHTFVVEPLWDWVKRNVVRSILSSASPQTHNKAFSEEKVMKKLR